MVNALITILGSIIGGGLFTFIIQLLNRKSSQKRSDAETDKIEAEAEQIRIKYISDINECLRKTSEELTKENSNLLKKIEDLSKEVADQSNKIDELSQKIIKLEDYITNNGLPLPTES